MTRSEILGTTEQILQNAGFNLSQRCCTQYSCFDLVAQGRKKILFLRAHADIGNTHFNEAAELQKISGCFSAIPFIIGKTNHKKPLEDDTVYSRYNVYAISSKTLENMFLRGTNPLVEAGPGGYYIQLDGALIRKRRQKLGLSVGKLAEMVGISRRTLYGYERGMAKASVHTAYRLEWILGAPVVKNPDVFHGPERMCLLSPSGELMDKYRFLESVFRKLAQFNFSITSTVRAPFDFIARCPKEDVNIIGAVIGDSNEQNIDQRIKELKSLGDVIGAYAVLVSYEKSNLDKGIPYICHDELAEMKCAEELFECISS
ncbi:MAG: helix-turn-helix domain-containing protein [Candidatus Bathyarchaeota archaeon]|nr:helix-turn-helix domain-containing protein [Candidatus Bathyarchaeota archaeon]